MTALDSLSPKRCAGNCHNKPLIRSNAWRGQYMGLRDFALHIERSPNFAVSTHAPPAHWTAAQRQP